MLRLSEIKRFIIEGINMIWEKTFRNQFGKMRKCGFQESKTYWLVKKKPFPNKRTPPTWLSGECVGIMTWWLGVRSPDEANFLMYFRLSPVLCRSM